MSAKPDTPITKKEMYLDAATGGSASLPEPVTIEEKYLAKIAGMTVDLPAPVPLKHKFLAKIAGMQVDVPTYTTGLPRIYAYLAKAAGQDVEVPQPITREEMYWFDYVSGQPTPSEQEYTGAVPVTFIANGQPLLDYLISGNTIQNGTPSPDNPIIPEGTGERTGNLIPEYPAQTKMLDGVNWNVSSNGKITGNGTTTSGTNFYLLSNYSIPLKAGTYTLSFVGRKNISLILRNVTTMTTICAIWSTNSSATFTVDDDIPETDRINLYFNTSQVGISVNIDGYPMLNLGDTALPYEPYGYKIPISSNSITTPVYLGEVETTRKIKKYEFTGNENWQFYSDSTGEYGAWQFYVDNAVNGLALSSALSNIAEYGATALTRSRYPYGVYLVTSGTGIAFQMAGAKDIFPGVTAWKSYLAQQYANGTPVTVWYVLATPTTAVVNEPLMKIGDYADTLSMEQAGVSVPTVAGSNTLDVLTEVKPSEVYIKYKGEPVPQLSMLSSPGTNAPEELSEEEAEEETSEETESITPETEE